jgi:hypothetical protein
MNQIYNEILSYINTLEIIDTHEHLPSNEGERDRNIDVIYKNLLLCHFSPTLYLFLGRPLKQKFYFSLKNLCSHYLYNRHIAVIKYISYQ